MSAQQTPGSRQVGASRIPNDRIPAALMTREALEKTAGTNATLLSALRKVVAVFAHTEIASDERAALDECRAAIAKATGAAA